MVYYYTCLPYMQSVSLRSTPDPNLRQLCPLLPISLVPQPAYASTNPDIGVPLLFYACNLHAPRLFRCQLTGSTDSFVARNQKVLPVPSWFDTPMIVLTGIWHRPAIEVKDPASFDPLSCVPRWAQEQRIHIEIHRDAMLQSALAGSIIWARPLCIQK